MSPFHSRMCAAAATVVSIIGLPVTSSASEMETSALIDALQSGGHIIYIRHAMTESDYADQVTANTANCATQRVLSEAGWAQAKAIGSAIRAHGIDVSHVVSSEYCRAWQTADLAFGDYEKTAALNFEKAEDYTEAQIAIMRGNVVPLLAAEPHRGNAVIIGHDDPFEAATGIYPEPQGVAFIIKPGADGFEVLGSIAPDGWMIAE